MKILVIFTGGTIGSKAHSGIIKPDDSANFVLIDGHKKRTGDKTYFETLSPCSFLSENLSAERINIILDTISAKIEDDYDGIILTHGTDTLQFTAAACAYAFANADKPLVIVSSDYPLGDSRANGFDNFAEAINVIKEGRKGVFVCYKNADKDETDTHPATRLIAYSECSDNLFSLQGNEPSAKASFPNGRYSDERDILVLDSMPNARCPDNLDGVKAIILRPYHSATVNTEDKELIALCERAKEQKIPVFLVNSREGKDYESKIAFEKMGIIVLPKCTFVAIYMKCWLAVSMDIDIKEFVNDEIYGEFC